MKIIADAIYTLFTAKSGEAYNALHIAIGGRMYYVKAPQAVTFPYIVYNIISDTPEYYFTETMLQTRIQFDIIAKSISEIEDISSKLDTVFNWKKLSVSGSTNLAFKRVLSSEIMPVEQDVFVRAIDYTAITQK